MKFENSFEIAVPPATAWETLTDIERVSPCLPGAELLEIRDNEFHGLITLRFGPITAAYTGTARFDEIDEGARRVVILASGRDRHGQGTAKARIEAQLTETDAGTRVDMSQDVELTGKAAQFGRGVLPDISREILGQFADNLSRTALGGAPHEAAANGMQANGPDGGVASEPASVDAAAMAYRIASRRVRERPVIPAAIGALILLAIVLRLTRRTSGHR